MNLIAKKTVNEPNFLMSKFKLLVRRSRDGFNHEAFRVKWRSPTIIIAKIKNTNKILGGFNTLNDKFYNFSLDRNNLKNSTFKEDRIKPVSDIRLFISKCFKSIYKERESVDELEIEECEV